MIDIMINGNRVLKEVSIDFQNKEYSLKVFGKYIDLESLGVNQCDLFIINEVQVLLYIFKRVNFCYGLEMISKKKSIF